MNQFHAFRTAAISAAFLFQTGCLNQITVDPASGLRSSGPVYLQEVYSDHIYSADQRVSYNPREYGKILMIPVEGIIASDPDMPRNRTSPAYIQEALSKAIIDKEFRAVILKIDSPGGTVHASDSIYRLITRYRDYTNLPVYAHIEGMGASGGYYAAMAAQHVNAAPSSMVGSIGVMMKKYTVTGLMDKLGIDYKSVKSGENKDMLAAEKPMTPAEEAILNEQIQESFSVFLSVILKSRGDRLTEAELRPLADGRIYSATQARNAKLIDSTQYFEDFIEFIRVKERFPSVRIYAYLPKSKSRYNLYNTRTAEAPDPAFGILQGFTEGRRNGLYFSAE